MDVKNKVLHYLETNKGEVVSGGKLASHLGVSRTAIWKAIKSLEDSGYSISASTNKGYSLSSQSDILSAQSIKPFLNDKTNQCEILVFDTIDSTNKYAKKLAQDGAKEGTIIISEHQSEGKGRLGRSFYSPSGTGIYMSIILRPKMSAEHALLITTSTAVAVSKAIEENCYLDTQIKWVNDIYSDGKKLCGILTEASLDFETGGLEYAIVGIGINVSTSENSFPEEIKNIATSIYPHSSRRSIRSKIIATIINNIFDYKDKLGCIEILNEYKSRSFLIGKEINIIKGETQTPAVAIDIDDKAQLIARLENGQIVALNAGEVSVRNA